MSKAHCNKDMKKIRNLDRSLIIWYKLNHRFGQGQYYYDIVELLETEAYTGPLVVERNPGPTDVESAEGVLPG